MPTWDEWKNTISRHAFQRKTPAATPWQGLVLGNADMGATIFGPAHQLTFRLSKLDLWDARWNEENYKHPLPLSKFKEFVFEESRKLQPGQTVPMDLNDCWQGRGTTTPCLRMAADLTVRVALSQPMAIPTTQRLGMEDGLYEARFPIGWWPNPPHVVCRAFISWRRNVLALRLTNPKGQVVVSLWRDPLGGRTWEALSGGPPLQGAAEASYQRDPRVGALPPSELAVDGHRTTLWQVIPGDAHCPERGFAVSAVCPEQAFFIEPSGQAAIEMGPGTEATIYLTVASEMEAPDARGRAVAVSQQAAGDGWDTLYAEHAEGWKRFWTRSRVALSDEALERCWVRETYAQACRARTGRPSPGLWGVSIPLDSPAWRGDRHNNFPEFASLFWGDFAANHEAQLLNYTEFVRGYLPTARRVAREVFECEGGAYYPHCYIDGTELYWFHFVWARSLYVNAIHAQNCWWHYQYYGGLDFLREMAYPVMRECADLYVELIKKNPPGDYTFWPTIAAEIRGWTKDFELNKNAIEDLAFIKFLLRATLEASETLDVDAPGRAAWRDILEHLPAYPTIVLDGKEEFTDFAGQSERPKYNLSTPLAPLWPAEDPDIMRDPRLRAIAVNTLGACAWTDIGRRLAGGIRLGLPEAARAELLDQRVPLDDLDQGFLGTERIKGTPFLIQEMLISSWDGVIRLFPAWPIDREARFADLRAKGAFLVSAACAAGEVRDVTLLSERGNPARVLPPWRAARVVRAADGAPVETTREDGILRFDTQAGESYRLQAEG